MDEVAKSDPNYIIWARGQHDLTDAEFNAIEEVREKHGIPPVFKKRRPRRAMRITRNKPVK